MGEFRTNLLCCTDTIRDAVAAGLPQKEVANLYAMAIKSDAEKADRPDWRAINMAILSKWKMSGLERIKKRAFDILSGEWPPAPPSKQKG